MKHKFFALLLAAMLCICPILSGCSEEKQADGGSQNNTEQNNQNDQT